MTEVVADDLAQVLDGVRLGIERFTPEGRTPEEKARILATAAALGEMLAVEPPSPEHSEQMRGADLLEIAQENDRPSGRQDVQDAISLLDSSMPGGDKVILEAFIKTGWAKTRANNARRLANLYRNELRAYESSPVPADEITEASSVDDSTEPESVSPEQSKVTDKPVQVTFGDNGEVRLT